MKRILFLSCALLLVAGDALAQPGGTVPPPSEWKIFRVRGEEFSIALPTVPALTTIKYPNWSYVRKERTERYLGVYADGVVYTIYSDDLDPQDSLEASLRSQNMATLAWGPATEQIVNRDGFTGKQFTSSHPLGGVLQLFATKKHFYRIQAFGATTADPRVQHFFSSLMFGKKDGIEVSDGPGTPFEPVDGSVKIPPDSVFTGKQVDRRIVLLQKPEPRYTETARQHQITGTVVLKAVFSANGSVLNIIVMSGLPDGLTEQSIAAVKKIKFIPAAKDGKFVSVWMQLEYNFNLY
ncbi:MAG TPA: TonB family protein [Pyrinomonadaceae bacterium]|nr:TonB family protein [Pyrinomonadaceae bacterium]